MLVFILHYCLLIVNHKLSKLEHPIFVYNIYTQHVHNEVSRFANTATASRVGLRSHTLNYIITVLIASAVVRVPCVEIIYILTANVFVNILYNNRVLTIVLNVI